MNVSSLSQSVRSYLVPDLRRRRLWMSLLGVLLCGVSVALFKVSAFGLDPYQCFMGGLDRTIPIRYGTLHILVSIVLLVNAVRMDQRLLGVSTILNLLFLGYVVDGTSWLLRALFGAPSLALRAVLMAVALPVTCYAAALYYSADMGVSVYDAIALHVSAAKSWPFRFVRIGTDLACVLIGLALGEKPGVGTIITAFCMGPLISFMRGKWTDPMVRAASPAEEERA